MSGPTPCYLEAYPSLAAKEVVAALSNQKSKCVWFDEAGLTAGRASLLQERHHGVSVRWSLVSDRLGYITTRDGDAILTLAEGALGANKRRLFMCPGCDSAVTRLLLATSGWACRSCHKLKYASQMEGAVLADDSLRTALRSEARGGKPHGQSNARRRQVERAFTGADQAGGSKVVIPQWEQRVSGPEWYAAHERVADRREKETILVRDRFSYWEAYPRIDAVGARLGLKRGSRLCLWMMNSAAIGGAEVDDRDGKLHLRYALQRTAHHAGAVGAAVFDIVLTGSQSDNKRWLLRCPGCGSARSALALVGEAWACRACHRLGYRAAMVGTGVRRAEKVAKLEAELTQLIQSGRSSTLVQRLEASLGRARAAAGAGPYPVVSRRYAYVLEQEWQSREFAEDGFYDDAADALQNGFSSPSTLGERRVETAKMMTQRKAAAYGKLRASPALGRALTGPRLFAEESVRGALDRWLEAYVIDLKTRSLAANTRPSRASLLKKVQDAWHLPPLTLQEIDGEPYVQKYEPREWRARCRPWPDDTLVTIAIKYLGSDNWWNYRPEGAEELQLRGVVSGKRLHLTVRVPAAEEATVPDLLQEAASLVRQVVNYQAQQIAAFAETVTERAAVFIDRALASEVRADMIARVKNIEF